MTGSEVKTMRQRGLVVLFVSLLLATSATAGPLGGLPPVTPDGNADRGSIPDGYKWKLADLYPDEEAWEQALAGASARLQGLARYHERLDDPKVLAPYLDGYFRLEVDVNRLKLYANLQAVTETTNQEFIARHQSAINLTNQIMEEGSTMRQAILAMSEDELAAAFAAVPELEKYRPAIDSLRRRADRVLGAEAERVLSLAGDNLWAALDLNELPSSLEQAFIALQSELPLPTITDQSGNEIQLTLANYGRYRGSADRRVRRDAVAALFGTLEGLENTLAATLGGQAQLSVFLARSRGYDTALEAYLDRDDLDPAVYHTLIDTVRAHAPALHRYVELRKRVMGVDDLHLYDLYVPMVKGVSREIPYAEGAEMMLESMEPLGGEYRKTVEWLLDATTGCVDVYPSSDKESGAFSASVYGVHPFIKMNYLDRFTDVSTLTHEFGHAVHTHLANTNQPYLTSRYVPFLAEVASTCNEALLIKHAVANAASDEKRAWLLSEQVERIRQVIYRQALFAEFELRLHELAEAGEPITADRLNGIYGGLIRDYYGPGYTIDPHDAIEWAYIPHLYYKYYVFVYATGMSSGIAIAERVAGGEPGAREAFLAMLSGGNSKPPLELLKGAGVDLTKPDAIASALELFDRTVAQLEELLLD
jgi:oligoendopeptidase F